MMMGAPPSASFAPGPILGNIHVNSHMQMHNPGLAMSALPPSAYNAQPFVYPGAQVQHAVPPVHLQGQGQGMVPFADGEYQMPYHHGRDPRMNPVFNTYAPPIQRAWENT